MLKKVFPQPTSDSSVCIMCLQVETMAKPFRKGGHCSTCKGSNNIIHKSCYKEYIKHSNYAQICPTCKTDKTKNNRKNKNISVVIPMPSSTIAVQIQSRRNHLNKCFECLCLSLVVGCICTIFIAFCAYVLLVIPGYLLIYIFNEIDFIDIPTDWNNPYTWFFSFLLSIVVDAFISGAVVCANNIEQCIQKRKIRNNSQNN